MSRIYFHSEHGTAELRGSERAYMGSFCQRLLTIAIGADDEYELTSHPSPLRELLPDGHYLKDISPDASNGRSFLQSLRTWLHVGDGALGIKYRTTPFDAALNTACVIGSDAVKLMARLHGQCELHAFVEGANRDWLASIIEKGRQQSVFRADMGWETIITLLRSRSDCPIVTSYSVCQQFPNPSIAGWKDEREGDAFWDLPNEDRWKLALTGLRESKGGLEMTPDNWAEFYFMDGITGFILREEAYNKKVSA
jgi:hypothetical protein